MSETERLNELVQPLATLARAGDRGALELIVLSCQRQIYRWVLSKEPDFDDADELTQMVMIRLGEHFAGYRGEARFTTWLYRLTSNVVADFHRNHARREKLSRDRGEQEELAVSQYVGAHTDERLDKIHNAEVAQLIRFFFEKLPRRQREVFDLVDLQGFTPSEVSRMIGMNASTVRANLLKARRAIRRRIIMSVPELAEELVE